MTRQLLTDDMRRRLYERRSRVAMSQQDMAYKIGTAQTAVSYWESGRRQPTFESLDRWCEALGLKLKVEIE